MKKILALVLLVVSANVLAQSVMKEDINTIQSAWEKPNRIW